MRPRQLHKARCRPGKEKPRRRAIVDKHTFWDRTRVPLIKKLNPIWWFRNDTEQSADAAPWYHPEWSRASILLLELSAQPAPEFSMLHRRCSGS
jgi:hypothetical protein